MNTKLTYKIKDIINKSEYIDVTIKHKIQGNDVKITNANVKFRYEPKEDKAYLSFGNSEEYTICEVEDALINEVIINGESLSIETNEKSYHCSPNKDYLYVQKKTYIIKGKSTMANIINNNEFINRSRK